MIDALFEGAEKEKAAVLAMFALRFRRILEDRQGVRIPFSAGLGFIIVWVLGGPVLYIVSPRRFDAQWLVLLLPWTLFVALILSVMTLAFYGLGRTSAMPSDTIFWAWEISKEERYISRVARGLRIQRFLAVGTVLALTVLTAFTTPLLLRSSNRILASLALWPLTVFGVALLAGFLLTLTEYISLPQHRASRGTFDVLDRTAIHYLNLAYYTHVSIARWNEPDVRSFLLDRLEDAAWDAETEFPGRDGHRTPISVETRAKLTEASLRLAATLRSHQLPIMTVTCRADLERVRASFIAGLEALATGDLQSLTSSPPERRLTRVPLRLARRLTPTLILLGSAILVPRIPQLQLTPEASQSLTLALLVPGVLATLSLLGAEGTKAGDTIQKAVDRFSNQPRNPPGRPEQP